jgi:multidrug efflux pump subunit AcrA (membrane-fusion protein)
MNNIVKKVRGFSPRAKFAEMRNSSYAKRAYTTTQKRPFFSFFIALGLLFGLILLGSILSNLGKKETPRATVIKEVSTYKLGEVPTIKLQAKVEKKGVIKIVALTPGIVNQINVQEGQVVPAGTTLVSLASNYNGANAQGVQAQLAGAQYRNAKETYDTQKDIIAKQREIAEQTRENTEELRRISEDALDDTRDSLEYNEDLLERIDDTIETLEALNTDGSQTQAILAARGQRSQLASGVSQIRTGLRQAEYSVGTDNPPTELADLQKDITLKQLDVQQKALDLGREVAGLQYTLASINASLMYPSAPFEATVQRIHVQKGQAVNPGTVLATISCLTPKGTIVINVPRNIAHTVSRTEPTKFTLGKADLSLVPTYVSTEATDGQLYAVTYTLPEGYTGNTTDQEYIAADVPIGIISTTSEIPYVPLDSVYQNQEETFVFVIDGSKVKSKKVKLGTVYGRYVEVEEGLDKNDQIVLSRNVVTGDTIKITN